MQRILIRLIVTGVIFCFSWIAYQLSDVTNCSGPRAEHWAENSLKRIEEANADMDSITEFTPLAKYDILTTRAKTRYMAQQDEATPECLADLQEQTIEALYYEWKAYESVTSGDYEVAITEIEKSGIAREAMEREFDRLVAKYNWDISD